MLRFVAESCKRASIMMTMTTITKKITQKHNYRYKQQLTRQNKTNISQPITISASHKKHRVAPAVRTKFQAQYTRTLDDLMLENRETVVMAVKCLVR